MSAEKIRKLFLKFFEKKGHTIVPSSSLIPDDPSVLLTTAGMQQFKPYYTNEKSPYGNNVVSVQKCFRTSDIDEVGDESHLTFFEMLGNFSFGGYFKEEAIKYAYEFITREFNLKIDYVSVFGGDEENNIPADEESEKIWKGIDSNIEIRKTGKEDNFWGPTGNEGPCGPTTEIYVKGVEIWNIVFNEYYKNKNGKFTKLKKPGVDTGMGLERLAMVVQGKNNIFETDLFEPLMEFLGDIPVKSKRIITDHIKAATFIAAEGIEPSNVERGYVLRRLIRQAIRYAKQFGVNEVFSFKIAQVVVEMYKDVYPELQKNYKFIEEQLIKEEEEFEKSEPTREKRAIKELERKKQRDPLKHRDYVTGDQIYEIYGATGSAAADIIELAKKRNIEIRREKDYEKGFKKHQELSRAGAEHKFKGGLADHSEQTTKYHTATHLLLAALRQILGLDIYQKGSNITAERLRFDFNYPQKLTIEQIKQVEDLVNQKIYEDLPVKMEEMNLEEAKKQGAMGVFEAKYADKVKVYTIDDFSKEICGGPHVQKTSELGSFKIIKEEASSAGVRRIKAVLSGNF